jgi:hypothetical protein
MTNLASYVLAGLAAVLVTDYFNPLVGTDPTPFGAIGAEPSVMISTQVVDRSHKGDRLDAQPQPILMVRDFQLIDVHPVRIQVFHPQPSSLPVGCDSLASALAESPFADLAGRCLT